MQGRLSEEHLHVENATWDVWYDETKSATMRAAFDRF